MIDDDCIRCGEAPAVDDQGYCGHCHWAVRAEITNGWHQMSVWLAKHDQFDRWCHEHGWDAA